MLRLARSRAVSARFASASVPLSHQFRYASSSPSSKFSAERTSLLAERLRTPEELNLRLSTCLYFRKPADGLRILENARKERLPFNEMSLVYVVYNLTLNGLYRRAEQVLEDYRTQERLVPPEIAYRYILSAYAQNGDFKNVQNLLNIMNRGEVPITEESYRHILQNAQKYFEEVDRNDPALYEKFMKQKIKLSSATPYQTFTPSFDEFVKSISKENETSNNSSSNKGKNKQKSYIERVDGTKGSKSTKNSSIKSLINDEDLAATRPKGMKTEEESFLRSSSLHSSGASEYQHAHLLKAITDIFQTTESDQETHKQLKEEHAQQIDDFDLGNVSDVAQDDYEPIVMDPVGKFSFKNVNDDESTKRCALTGIRLEKDGGLNPDDSKIPFHPYNPQDSSGRYIYLDSSKEPISEQFSVEDKIERGEGVMLDIDEDILYSLTYDRFEVAGRSMLSMMVEDGLEASSALYAAIVDGFGRGGNVNALEESIRESQQLGCDTNNAVINRTISSYARNLCMDQLRDTLSWADKNEIPLNHDTLNCLMYAYSETENFDQMLMIRDQLISTGYTGNPNLESSMLYMHAVRGDIKEIENVLKQRIEAGKLSTTQTYGAIIRGLSKNKNHEKVVSYYKQMIKEKLNPSERSIDFAFMSFYKLRDLPNMTECLWSLRYFGYKTLTPKRAECIIDLLCSEKQFSAAIKLLSYYKHISFMLKPRNFTFLLEGLLKKEKISIINTLEPTMRWPCYVALSMIYGPRATAEDKPCLQLIEEAGHSLTGPVVDGSMYYHMKKNDAKLVQDSLLYCVSHEPAIPLPVKSYVFAFLALFRNKQTSEAASLLSHMHDNDITIAALANSAKENLSRSNFQELWEEFHQRADINLRKFLAKEDDKPNILDYIA